MKHIETIAKFASTLRIGRFALLSGLLRGQRRSAPKFHPFLPVLVTASLFVVPATASAYAAIEAPPLYSSAPGLPDGRVYEQVSPADKNGNEAGATDQPSSQGVGGEQRYGFAAADGDAVLFEGTGPMGEAATAMNPYFVASKNLGAAGWTTRGVTPKPQQPVPELNGTAAKLVYVDPSPDLSHAMFEAGNGTYALPPGPSPAGAGCEADQGDSQIYLTGSDPFVPATWLERPDTEDPIANCEDDGDAGAPVGGTPDFSTAYFTFPGTLLPEDAQRAPHTRFIAEPFTEAWGFYEVRGGALREAGVLPDGKLDPFGAVPAASGRYRALDGNEVSTQPSPDGAEAGSLAFFVSPDPASCEQNALYQGQNNCEVDPPELYVRENGARTQLVSRDKLLPAASGLPAAAPDGVFGMPNSPAFVPRSGGSYVFASPDGSQAFFQSQDALTEEALNLSPGAEPKTYDFDVETGVLTYLPGVAGKIEILATDTNGSSFAFVRPETEGSPAELDLWSAGPAGGKVTSVTQLPGGATSGGTINGENDVFVSEARVSSDGSVLVFVTAAPIAGFNNGGTHTTSYGEVEGGSEQIYRYDAPANTLGCVSCPPHGVTPTGDAVMSPLQHSERDQRYDIRGFAAERGISADGDRIFFDTPDPLVPQDKNARTIQGLSGVEQEGRDVYEWENGVVYLLTSGKSQLNSFFLDNSENGDDLFFATTEGLVPGDSDGAYDVYDARVPQPGDNAPAAAVPCEGAVCQGPPHAQSPLAPPARATFAGSDNLTPELAGAPAAKPKQKAKTKRCKKGYVKKKAKCIKQTKAKKSAKGKK